MSGDSAVMLAIALGGVVAILALSCLLAVMTGSILGFAVGVGIGLCSSIATAIVYLSV